MSRPWSRWVSTTKSHPASPRAFIGESRDPSSCVSRRALTWRCGRNGPTTSKSFEISWTTSAPTNGDRHVDSAAASRETSEAPDRDARRPGLRPLPLDRRYRPHRQFADEPSRDQQPHLRLRIYVLGPHHRLDHLHDLHVRPPGRAEDGHFPERGPAAAARPAPVLLNSVELASPLLSPAEASAIGAYASTLFTLDLSGILLILAAFAHVLNLEEKN